MFAEASKYQEEIAAVGDLGKVGAHVALLSFFFFLFP